MYGDTHQMSTKFIETTSSEEQSVTIDDILSSRSARRSFSVGRSERRRQTGRSDASPTTSPIVRQN